MLAEVLSPWSAAVLLLAVASVSAAIAAGRRRRQRWLRSAEALDRTDGPPQPDQIGRVRRELRASQFMSESMRRVYYLLTLLSAIALMALPLLGLEPGREKLAQLSLTATSFVGALALLAYWYGSDDERERELRKRLLRAQERAHARRGLAVRDQLTGAYTLDFWLHVQELRTRRFILRQNPVTCIMFDVEGLAELRIRRGSMHSDDLLKQMAREITHNMGPRGLVARYRGQRFVIALHHTPPVPGRRVAQRISRNLDRLLLETMNRWHGSHLSLRWSTASIPRDAATPIQLLRVTETTLDVGKSLVSA